MLVRVAPRLVRHDGLAEALPAEGALFVDERAREACLAAGVDPARLAAHPTPRAIDLLALGGLRLAAGSSGATDEPEPLYLRAFGEAPPGASGGLR